MSKGLPRSIDQYSHELDAFALQVPAFTQDKATPQFNLEHQVNILRSVNNSYKDRINQLSDENRVLQARVSILCSMLCDAGVPLPPDIE